MGEVYEADDLELQEPSSHQDHTSRNFEAADAIVRFKREIHLGEQVTHPTRLPRFDSSANSLSDRKRPYHQHGAAAWKILAERLEDGKMVRSADSRHCL